MGVALAANQFWEGDPFPRAATPAEPPGPETQGIEKLNGSEIPSTQSIATVQPPPKSDRPIRKCPVDPPPPSKNTKQQITPVAGATKQMAMEQPSAPTAATKQAPANPSRPPSSAAKKPTTKSSLPPNSTNKPTTTSTQHSQRPPTPSNSLAKPTNNPQQLRPDTPKSRPKAQEAKMLSALSSVSGNLQLPTAVEPALLTAIVSGSVNSKKTQTTGVFQILNEQHALQTKVDPAYCPFPCRFLHTANTMDGSHRISRYSHPNAFYGMQPTKPIPLDWVQVPRADTFTLGNGVVILGGSYYKRVKGAHGTAIRVKGLIAVGVMDHKCDDIRKNISAGGPIVKPVVVNVLPSESTVPFPLWYFREGTRIGRHLRLGEGSFLDSDCVIHGPFTYKEISFCENEIIHADGTFARFHDNSNELLPVPGGAPPPSYQRPHTSSSHKPKLPEKRIYVEMCMDRLLNPLPISAMGTEEDFRSSLGLNARDAAAATIVTAAVAASAAAVVSSTPSIPLKPLSSSPAEGPRLDCFGYDSTILPTSLSAALWRSKAISHVNAIDADAIRLADDERKCGYCGVLKGREKLRVCVRCRGVRYCSPECLEKGWKGGHRRWCLSRGKGGDGGGKGV
ncbi:hypothetical protein HDV00_004573 [Rhizophlyctis rosea]|nr:hypothetical protein HDV00_004573 [Rhizophlyctis rosea]